MKKLYLMCVFGMLIAFLVGMPSAKSILYADSYMLRADGVEANYWNPARLHVTRRTDLWLPVFNSGIYVNNNSLDLDTYNFFVSQDTLQTQDKERILKGMEEKMSANSEAAINHFGFTAGNLALSSSSHVFAKGCVQRELVELALYGNVKDSYSFSKKNNQASLISYADFTLGMGGMPLPFLPEELPEIKVGLSVSALAGLAHLDTREFEAQLSFDMDGGCNLDQMLLARSAIFGLGFKSMLGMYSEVMPNLELGLTMDNLFGNIRWLGKKEEYSIEVSIDSLYIANFSEDFYQESTETNKIAAYNSPLGTQMRFAAKYSLPKLVLSLDYLQGFSETAVSSTHPRFSAAVEGRPLKFLPLGFGIALPDGCNPVKFSYFTGVSSQLQDFLIGVQSFGALIPGYKSKGIAFAWALRFWF